MSAAPSCPSCIATPVLFFVGAAFVFYVMLPFAIRFFVGYETPGGNGTLGIELQAKVSEYLDFVMTLIFAFGLTFQTAGAAVAAGPRGHRQRRPTKKPPALRRGGHLCARRCHHARPMPSAW